jgi:aerobic carbon-monoxide dehydrogenase small subunit
MTTEIRLKLNGEKWRIRAEPTDLLMEVLRDKLGAKSVKCGCERGDCGACTVLLNGRSVRSCLVLAVEADGCEITTVEGICQEGLTPLQKEFLSHNSFQCGFCAPGIVVAATELLAKNPKPSTEEIQEAIGGHLCRCTGYTPIVEAVESAGKKGR